MASDRTLSSSTPPAIAALTLAVVAAATVALIAIALGLPPEPETGPVHGDLDTYAEIVANLRAGQGYYAALHEALLAHGYSTISVFNWRPPLFLSAVAWLPSTAWMQAITGLLAVVALAMARVMVFRHQGRTAALSVSLLLALSLAAVLAPRAGLICELLAGALILLSVSAYGLGQRGLGVAAGAAALFTREIAGLYVVVCVLAAWREKRWLELGLWLVLVVAYGLYFGWHTANVTAQLGPHDHGDSLAWLRFGGATFDLLTATFNGIFLVLPNWVTALLLPVSVLGLVAWRDAGGVRALWTVLGYLVLFAFVGKPTNSYWGALYTPLLALGLVHAPTMLRELVSAALRRRFVPA
jgi:hypothetical protein